MSNNDIFAEFISNFKDSYEKNKELIENKCSTLLSIIVRIEETLKRSNILDNIILSKEQIDHIMLLYKTCLLTPENIDKLSNNIFNIIAEKYEKIYSNTNKSNPQYENIIQFLDAWSASGMERILAAANMLSNNLLEKALKVQTASDKTLLANLQLDKLIPKNLIPKDLDKTVSKQLDKTIPKDLEQLVSKQIDKSIPNPKETPKVIPSEEKKSKGETQLNTSSNDNIYYIGGGITVIIIIIILIVLRLMKKI
jgi:translation elongation factor EF-G